MYDYPRVSKALRDIAKQQAGEELSRQHTHSCSFGALQGTGHKELDDIVQNQTPLIFEIELLRVEQPGDYKKDHWAMTEGEKDDAIPKLKQEGNTLYKSGHYQQASEKYFEALSYLEEMTIKEKPNSETWDLLAQRKIPFLLNYSQCKLSMGDYADVIRHTSTVLEIDNDNVKALFRRAKAHMACWNVLEAKTDFEGVVKLDPSLTKTVDKELRDLSTKLKDKDSQEKEQFHGKLFGQ